MGKFGFSYIGLVYLMMLAIPNIIWTKHLPKDYSSVNENKILASFEKIGQVLVSTVSLIFIDFNLKPFSLWYVWLFLSFFFMIMYELWWVRYFKSKQYLSDFYSSFLGIPVAGATLPIIAFFLLGIYGKNIFLILSIIILGIGHIGIHLEQSKLIKK